MENRITVAESRNYIVRTVKQAKEIANVIVNEYDLTNAIKFGLPEVDDRTHIWRVPLLNGGRKHIGEVVIDAKTSLVDESKSTKKNILEKRLLNRNDSDSKKAKRTSYVLSSLRNTIGLGDSEKLLSDLPN